MADATGVNSSLPTRIGGVSTSSGLPDYYADVTSLGQLLVKDASDGSVTAGTAASFSQLMGGQYNSTLPTLTNTQQSAIQLDSNGRLITSPSAPLSLQGSGTIVALNGTVVATTAGYGALFFNITGTWVGTLQFQATNGDGNWFGISAFLSSTGLYNNNSTTVNTTAQINCAGYYQVRVIATAYTSGTATVSWYSAPYEHLLQIYQIGSPANLLTNSYTLDGNGNLIGSSSYTSGSSLYTTVPDKSTTGTLGALNAVLNIPINNVSSAYALISGTWVGTIQFQGSVNGSTFVPLEAVQGGPLNAYSTAGFTSNGGVRIALPAGFTSIQAVMTAYTSGTATVVINTTSAPANVEVVQFNAANLNASIGSIVTDLDKTITGTITALNGTVTIATNGTSTVNASISGTWVATLVIEGQSGDGIWYALQASNPNGGLNINSFTSNNLYIIGSGGFTQVRIRALAYTSGTVNVAMDASSGSAQTLAVDANGNQQIVGNVASGTADSGNGVKVSGIYNSTLPTFTNGQRADFQTDAKGAQIVSTKVPRTYSAPQTALVNTTSTLILAANANRKGLYLSNTTGAQQVSFAFDGNAAAYQYGITLYPGEKFWMDEYSFSTGAIYAITTGTTTYIGIQEIT